MPCKALTAFIAFEWSLTRVDSAVQRQFPTPRKGLSTFVAFEGPLARVDSDVLRQAALCFECLSTLGCSAFEGSLARVRPNMRSECTFELRRKCTDVTFPFFSA